MIYHPCRLRHLRSLIGYNIRRLRTKRKMPLRKLARLAEVPQNLIDHYELGKGEVSLDNALKIACALRTSVEALMRDNHTADEISGYDENEKRSL